MSSLQLKTATKLARRSGIHVPGGVNGGGWMRLANRLGADSDISKSDAKRFISDWLEKRQAASGCTVVRPKMEKAALRPAHRASVLTYDQANSDDFLSSFAWKQLRWKVLKHYGARCMCCGASPEHGAVMNVDHIKSRRRRPDLALDFDNLQVLCGPCNHGKGNDEADFRPAAESIDPAVTEFIRSIARER
jgi:HNH endonuclease